MESYIKIALKLIFLCTILWSTCMLNVVLSIKLSNFLFKLPIKDVVSYNVMISGFASHGHGEVALKLFSEMLERGIQPDRITFLGILYACSQIGCLELCQYYFNCDYGIEPFVDHCACMVEIFWSSRIY